MDVVGLFSYGGGVVEEEHDLFAVLAARLPSVALLYAMLTLWGFVVLWWSRVYGRLCDRVLWCFCCVLYRRECWVCLKIHEYNQRNIIWKTGRSIIIYKKITIKMGIIDLSFYLF